MQKMSGKRGRIIEPAAVTGQPMLVTDDGC